MKLLPDTIALLKNFAGINNEIILNPGNQIATTSQMKNIVAIAEISEGIDREIGIFNLPEFLNVMGMFQDPVIDLSSGVQAHVREGKTVVKYTFSEPALLTQSVREVTLSQPFAEFELKVTEFQSLMKAAAILGLTEIYFKGDGKKLTIGAMCLKSSSTNTYSFDIGDTDSVFETYVSVELFKHPAKNYRVAVTKNCVAFTAILENTTLKSLAYYITPQVSRKG